MLQIVVGNTNAGAVEALDINPHDGFRNVVARLEDLRDFLNNACIVQKSLDELIWLFKNLEIVSFGGCGNIVCSDDYAALRQAMLAGSGQGFRLESFHQVWLRILRDIAEDIDELYNYVFDDKSSEVIFLRNVLYFLTFTDIADNSILYEPT